MQPGILESLAEEIQEELEEPETKTEPESEGKPKKKKKDSTMAAKMTKIKKQKWWVGNEDGFGRQYSLYNLVDA